MRNFLPLATRATEPPEGVVNGPGPESSAGGDGEAPARPRRRRKGRLARGIRFAGILLLLGGVPIGAKWAYENWLQSSSEFRLIELVIRTDGSLSEARIAATGGVEAGMDLMKLDLSEVRTRLEELPGVRQAVVTRHLPGRLTIRVEERVPVAWLACPPHGIRARCPDTGLFLDAEGFAFRRSGSGSEHDLLPVIESSRIARPAEGSVVASDDVEAALDLIQRSRRLFQGSEHEVMWVRVGNEWSMESLFLDGMKVTFHRHEVERGLRDLALILERMEETPLRLATVDVAVAKNIPVTFRGEVEPASFGRGAGGGEPGAGSGSDEEAGMDPREKHLRSILNGG